MSRDLRYLILLHLTVNNDLLLELNKYLLIYLGLADHLHKLAGIPKEEEKPSDDDDSDPDGIKSAPEVGPFSQRDSCLSLAFFFTDLIASLLQKYKCLIQSIAWIHI